MTWLLVALTALALAQAPALDEDLITAARRGELAAVKSLLERGASLEAKTPYGQTPLFFAARNGHEEVVRFLLSKGASPNIEDTFYKMSLLAATADKGYARIVMALIDAGANGAGDALDFAAYRGNQELTTLLLASGKMKPENLTAALSTAEQTKHPEIAEILKKAGAKPAPAPDATVSEDKLRLYAGTYRGDPIGDLVFTFKDGKLTFAFQGQNFTLGAFDDTTFGFAQQPGAKLKFTVEEGKATAVTYMQGSQSYTLKRVETK